MKTLGAASAAACSTSRAAVACSLAPLVFLLAMLAASRPAAADPHPNTEGGVDVAQAFQLGDVDSINLFNGALTVAVPIGIRFPVNGNFSYQLTLVANSNPWDFSNRIDPNTLQQWQDSAPSHCSNAGLGWRVSLGALGLGTNPSPPTCAPTDVDTPSSTVYEAPDGSQHLFYQTLHPNEPVNANVMYTRDGTYLRLNLSSDHSEIQFPDGTVHRFGADGRIVQMRDAFNDQVNIAYLPIASCSGSVAGESSCWQISDTQGRVQWIYFRNDLAPYTGAAPYGELISRVVPMAFNNAVAPYVFNYQTQNIARGCPVNDPMLRDANNNYPVSVPLLLSVTRPDGSSFAPGGSGYLTTPGTGCLLGSGSLTALTLPTLGSVSWSYQTYSFPTASSTKARRTTNPGVQIRTVADARGTPIGHWTYSTYLASNTAAQQVNTVTDPLGNQHARYFSVSTAYGYGPGANVYDYGRPYTPNTTYGNLFLSEQVFDGGGNVKRTSYVRYERDVIDQVQVPDALNNDGREAQRETVYDDGSQAGSTDTDFDGVGHYRTRTTDGTFAGNDLRVERTNYNPNRNSYNVDQASNTSSGGYVPVQPSDPWVLGTSTYAYAQENGVSELRSFCFDPNTGFLNRRRLYVQSAIDPGAMSANDVVQQFVPDGGGNVVGELSFGGDNAPFPPTSSDLCQQTLPAAPEYRLNSFFVSGVKYASQYAGAGFYTLNRGIDQATGLPTYSRDTANIQTNFTYDPLGRLVYVLPRDGAWTQYLYHAASSPSSLASLTVIQQQNGSPSTSLAQTKSSYDALGRLIEQDVQMPDGTWSARTTSYNALGWKTAVSAQGSPNTNLTQYLNFDPFGRATLIRPPDSTAANGFAHDVKMSYGGVRTVSRTVSIGTTWNGASVAEAPSTTTETYDRFGRLASVMESSGSGGAAVTTSYLYDAGNRLSQVSTPTAGTTQTRTFNYDHRGFLAWETHPETAPNHLGDGHHKDYLSYDSRGHFHRTVEGSNDLSYLYDVAERPTLVYNTAYGANCNPNPISTPTCVKQFTYDNVAAGALGRLYQASRFNHILFGGNPYTDEWTYTYTYAGLDGRVSQRTLQHTFNGQATGNQESFTQGWTYTQLGKIDTETYPNCAPAFTSCSGTTNLAPQNLYANGFLTGVNGYTASPGITYYPNGMVSSVTHANGVSTTYGLDPSGMPRPASITATGLASTLWSTGPYAYDGAGNVTEMGHAGYDLYDGVSRLTTAVVQTNAVDNPTPTANATVSQSVSYDAFGNIQAFVGSPGISTPTDPGSNRLTGGTYDASGNLRSWNGASYDYDELNQLKHYVNGAQEWFYMYDADGERVWQFQPATNGLARFDRWTLRGLDAKVRRTFELYGYAWGNAWGGSNLWEDYVYRGGLLLASSYSDGYQRHFDVDHLGTPRLITGPASGQTGGFYTLTPCRILDTRQTGAPLTQANPQHVYQISGACGVPANAQAVTLNVTLVNATTNLSVQGYPGDAPGAPGTNVVSASPPVTAVIAGAAVLPLATDGSGTLGVLMTLAPPATSGQTDLILDVSGYFAPASVAPVAAYHAYLPFGAEATYFAQDFERMKFTGHERDLADPSSPAADLDYMHARHYNFLTGRFLSPDPKARQAALKDPQRWNRYGYVSSNPLKLVDLTGKEQITFQITTQITQPLVAAPAINYSFGSVPAHLYAGGMKTTQLFTIETDPKKAADPIVASHKETGVTNRVDLNGNVIEAGKASADSIVLLGGRDSAGNALVVAGTSANNPLEALAPPIFLSVTIQPSQSGGSFSADISFGGYPTATITATNSSGDTLQVFDSPENASVFGPLQLIWGYWFGNGETLSVECSFSGGCTANAPPN
ncbi:MAG TPA: RHS repeat-associated core domain-containing protein [Thermoanaerobaculia bacterium]|jgi:RHS repeat-associated protein|nr:RHS repeat-associated core domain-containing protein [Thermoanaerobaculia bacterium]